MSEQCPVGNFFIGIVCAFLGYDQIHMAPEDEEKLIFIIDCGLFCYRVMPFDLSNLPSVGE